MMAHRSRDGRPEEEACKIRNDLGTSHLLRALAALPIIGTQVKLREVNLLTNEEEYGAWRKRHNMACTRPQRLDYLQLRSSLVVAKLERQGRAWGLW